MKELPSKNLLGNMLLLLLLKGKCQNDIPDVWSVRTLPARSPARPSWMWRASSRPSPTRTTTGPPRPSWVTTPWGWPAAWSAPPPTSVSAAAIWTRRRRDRSTLAGCSSLLLKCSRRWRYLRYRWMDERMNGWMTAWMNEWMNGWMNEWMNAWMN